MIGISLRFRWLLGTKSAHYPDPQELLPLLYDAGVRSIELRPLAPNDDPDEVLGLVNSLWDQGFFVTVHGSVDTVENAVEEVFYPLRGVLANMRQDGLTVTLHPINGDNRAMLLKLSDHINENKLPVRIALENNKHMPDKSNGDCVMFVLDIVRDVNRENIGICFDLGHYAYYCATQTDNPIQMPDKEFLARTIHTHIHAFTNGVAHFPLTEWREPFASQLKELARSYNGIYNIEISPHRYKTIYWSTDSFLTSVKTLKENLKGSLK